MLDILNLNSYLHPNVSDLPFATDHVVQHIGEKNVNIQFMSQLVHDRFGWGNRRFLSGIDECYVATLIDVAQ